MPDFEITLTSTNPHTRETWLRSANVMDTTEVLAVPLGISELFRWCEEDGENNPIPADAIAYWKDARTKPIQFYEVLTELEQRWGLTFGRQPLNPPPPPKVESHPHHNGNGRARPSALPSQPRFDLKSILEQQLSVLQSRQKDVNSEIRQLQAERESNNEQIQQITSYLLLTVPKKSKRKGKVDANFNSSAVEGA